MRIECDSIFMPGWLVTKIQPPVLSASFLVKGTFKLVQGGVAVAADEPDPPDGDIPSSQAEPPGLRYASDIVPFKPHADVLLFTTCYAPGGKPATVVKASIKVGPVAKSLLVVGDRVWHRGLLSSTQGEPMPFTSMPVIYEKAFGGNGYEFNPAGKGYKQDLLPNLEDFNKTLHSPSETSMPACFAPIPSTWGQRMDRIGTFNSTWLKTRWPWFPQDFNFEHFQSAPRDQQVVGYLKGDEEIVLENLHPKHAKYSSKLPAIRARLFVMDTRGGKKSFREVPMKLDTCFIDGDAEKLVLIWRGVTDVLSIKLKEINWLFCVAEPLDKAQSVEYWQKELERRIAAEPATTPEEEEEKKQEAAEEKAAAVEKKAFDAEFAKMDAEFAKFRAEGEASFKTDEAALLANHQRLITSGTDATKLAQPGPNPAPPTSPSQFKAHFSALDQQIAQANVLAGKTRALGLKPGEKAPPPPEPAAQPKYEVFEDEADDPEYKPWTRERVIEAHGRGHDFQDQTFSGLDLSGLNLSGIRLGGAMLANVNFSGSKLTGAILREAMLTEANLEKADLSEADLQDSILTSANLAGARLDKARLKGAFGVGMQGKGASFASADMSDAALKACNFAGASFIKAKLTGCELDKSVLNGCDFTQAAGEGISLVGAKLDKAKFSGASLTSCDFDECTAAGADFAGAHLPNCSFESVKAAAAIFERCEMTGFRGGEGSDFSGCNFKRIVAPRSAWPESVFAKCDFAFADLSRAIFSGAQLDGVYFGSANLEKADFSDASLKEANFTLVNALRANFERADLTKADLRGANLYEAEFWGAKMEKAALERALVTRTKLAP